MARPARPSETQAPRRGRCCVTRLHPVPECRSALPDRPCQCEGPTSPAPASSSVRRRRKSRRNGGGRPRVGIPTRNPWWPADSSSSAASRLGSGSRCWRRLTPQLAPSAGRPPPLWPGRKFLIHRRWAETSFLRPCRRPSPGCYQSPPRLESRSGSLHLASPRSRRRQSTPTRSMSPVGVSAIPGTAPRTMRLARSSLSTSAPAASAGAS